MRCAYLTKDVSNRLILVHSNGGHFGQNIKNIDVGIPNWSTGKERENCKKHAKIFKINEICKFSMKNGD